MGFSGGLVWEKRILLLLTMLCFASLLSIAEERAELPNLRDPEVFKKIISEVEHVYSHFKMKLIVMDFIICDDVKNSGNSFSWIFKKDIDCYAFHRANHKVFKLFKSFNWDV